MQPLEALRLEGGGLRGRIVVEHGRLVHVALLQADALAVLEVDCREQDHGVQPRKLAISFRPSVWLFSGWNCVPAMLSRATMAVTGPPWSVTASTSSRRGRRPAHRNARNRHAGRRARSRCPSSSGWSCRLCQRVPAHMRDLERGVVGHDQRDIARESSRAPASTIVFEPARGQQLHADADAEERAAALALHDLLQRLDHAGHGVEAAPAIGEGADARQHDPVGGAHLLRIAGDADRRGDARFASPPARRPWRPSADCPSRNR